MLSVVLLALLAQDAPAETPVFIIPAPVTAPAATTDATAPSEPVPYMAVPVTTFAGFADAGTRAAQRKPKKIYGSILEAQSIASTFVITRATLERNRYRTLAEALEDVAEFYVYRNMTGEGLARRWLRDDFVDDTQSLFLLNGVPLRMLQGLESGSDVFPIDMESVERIEIVRGSAGVTFGERAIFAVVNIVTRDPGKDGNAALGGRLGSVRDGYFRYSRRIEDQWGFLALNQQGERARFGVPFTDIRNRSAVASGGYGPWSLNAYAADAKADADFWRRPSGAPDAIAFYPADDPARYLTNRMGVEGRFDHRQGLYTVSAHIGHERVRMREYSLFNNMGPLNFRSELEERRFRAGARYSIVLPLGATLVAFGDYARLDGIAPRMTGEIAGETSAGWHERSGGLSFTMRPTRYLGIDAGLRSYWLGFTRDFGNVYSAAVALSPMERLAFKLLYTEGYRASTLFQNEFRAGYVDDVQEWYWQALPEELKLQTSRSIAAVAEATQGLVTTTATCEQLRLEGTRLSMLVYNGCGAMLGANLNPLRLSGQISAGKHITDYNPYHWSLVGQIGGPLFVEGASLAGVVRYDVRPGLWHAAQDRFWRWDFTMSYAPTKVIELTAKLRNAFGQTAPFEEYALEQLGTAGDERTYWVGLSLLQD